eukprot:TRINITY_DN20784_c0_g1_i1.p1 TRINITY_DN20784_c0_g1~~TRINITY_DN20784_c0_g1_i1.p1  ORF type:complete len:162 (+),score=38.00 TRINITY_DN20784_c0_g1_i1:240-725(+)
MTPGLINPNPKVHEIQDRKLRVEKASAVDEFSVDVFDAAEIFDHLRDIQDPEHPYSLEQLNVISPDAINVDDANSHILIKFTPTVMHCSMATLIGLCLRVKLMRSLPPRFKVDIMVSPGSHASEASVNKQLNDKERVAAALENPHLVDMVDKCLNVSEEGW